MAQLVAQFDHEALLYEGLDGFLDAAVPFLREGLEAGEPAMVAVGAAKISLLEDALGGDAEDVRFVDMAELGRNPGRIIPAWADFRAERGFDGRGVRGIGEPIWAGRSPAELVECQLHESLLNLAFADAEAFKLLCPYDVGALEAGVVHEACASHPVVVDGGGARASRRFRRGEKLLAPFEAPLPAPPPGAESVAFDGDMLGDVRHAVALHGERAGLAAARVDDLVLAVNEVVANSVRHGGGHGVLRVWREDGVLVCEVKDRGRIRDPLAGRRTPHVGQLGGRGLWLAHVVSDLVQLRSDPDGTVVRVSMRLA
jgi:anti-sigma regulatory factor (Ser/Thr protein kinase)